MICLTVVIEDILVILAILGLGLYNIFFPIIIYSLIEIVCFALITRKVKNGQALGRIIRQAKIGLMISCSIIIMCSLIICILILSSHSRFINAGIVIVEGYTWLILLPRIIAFGYGSYANGYVCISRPINWLYHLYQIIWEIGWKYYKLITFYIKYILIELSYIFFNHIDRIKKEFYKNLHLALPYIFSLLSQILWSFCYFQI